jgi:hypothetical protein
MMTNDTEPLPLDFTNPLAADLFEPMRDATRAVMAFEDAVYLKDVPGALECADALVAAAHALRTELIGLTGGTP